jgi:hypothetical protein
VFGTPQARAAIAGCLQRGQRAVIGAGPDAPRWGGAIAGVAEPILRDGHAVGALVLGWGRARHAVPERVASGAFIYAAAAGRLMERLECDNRERARRALAIDDNIVQGLAVAKYAIAQGQVEGAAQAIDETLRRARRLVTDQLDHVAWEAGGEVRPGDLVREDAPALGPLAGGRAGDPPP